MTITKTTNTTTRYNKQQTTNNKTIRVFNFGFSILLLLKRQIVLKNSKLNYCFETKNKTETTIMSLKKTK